MDWTGLVCERESVRVTYTYTYIYICVISLKGEACFFCASMYYHGKEVAW